MSKYTMISPQVPNVPWQERPADLKGAPVWRYNENPIIGRNPVEGVARIFNSAVMPYEGEFIGVFRAEQTNGIPYIYLGRSKDAIHWEIDKEKINFVDEDGKEFMSVYAYDPRLVKIEDTYYIMWCQDFYGASIGLAKTTDFKTFVRLENPFLPFNRNAVMFPRKINGNFVMMSRPSDSGHTPFGDIFISESPDLVYWGRHRHEKGSLGKMECWYVLDCPKDAKLVLGHKAKSQGEVREMVEQGKWEDFLQYVPVKKGDFIQIDPGTVHAITTGCLLLETQQNSDVTYRVYDYGRLSNGKPRELHVQKSIDVILAPAKSPEDMVKHVQNLPKNTLNELISCQYYTVFKLDLEGEMTFEQSHPFLNISVTEGEAVLNGTKVKKGDHLILPAEFGAVKLEGKAEIIASAVR